MEFKEKINATVGQLVNELEQYLEEFPQIASVIVTDSVYDDDYPITVLPDIVGGNHDYQDNYVEYICLAFADEDEEEGTTVAEMLEILKGLDPNTGVLFQEEPESTDDSGLRNLLPDNDGSFIQCDEDEPIVYIWSDDEGEIKCLDGIFSK